MTGKRIYQLLLSFLCILLAVLICSAAVRICRDGSRRKAEHPMETVYTKEAVEDASAHIAPLFIVVAVMAGGRDRAWNTGRPESPPVSPGTECR